MKNYTLFTFVMHFILRSRENFLSIMLERCVQNRCGVTGTIDSADLLQPVLSSEGNCCEPSFADAQQRSSCEV